MPSRPLAQLPARRLALAAAVFVAVGGAARADIVTLGPNPQSLPACPLTGLPWFCIVDQAARVEGTVSNYEAVRVGRTPGFFNAAGLQVGSGSVLQLNSNAASANLIVGDNFGAAAGVNVTDGGRVVIDVPFAGGGSGGLILGPFVAPADAPLGLGGIPVPSTNMLIADGGSVTVTKPGGPFAGAAVGIGYGVGSRSSLVLDGSIGGFGVPAQPVSLSTTGNISIGREGTGDLSLFRHATVDAHTVYMSAISPTGSSTLDLFYQSTLTGTVYAGIALNVTTGLIDAQSPAHGTAVVSVAETSFINGSVTLGAGGTLYGTGRVGSVTNLGGTVRPGFSPGTLHIDHDYTDVGGTLVIEIGPTASDYLDVLGKLSLDGTTVEFAFVGGFAPDAGFSYEFFRAQDPDADSDVTLTNVHYTFSGLQPGFDFTVELDPLTGGARIVALNAGVAVPEPGGLALVGMALLGAGAARRARRAAS